jgi:hypothetical protein
MPQSVVGPYQPTGMGAGPGMPPRALDRPPVVHERGSTSIYAPPRKFGPRGPLRKGKWTPEEEVYAHFIIDAFNKGLIDLPRGECRVPAAGSPGGVCGGCARRILPQRGGSLTHLNVMTAGTTLRSYLSEQLNW